MTTGKRALIVDDSRSARVILSRMLEQHGMTVDTAESAEQALDYLQRSRPDVIFMDHLMPGMDGFQAVQTIKADPLTATIPLMMYTSQEGELYVSQARALGAVGVLPKTVRPVDVSRILYQLHLLPDRRTQRTALFAGPAAAAGQATAAMPGEAAMAAALAALSPAQDLEQGESGDLLSATGTREALAPAAFAASPAAVAFTPALVAEFQAGLRQSVQHLVKDQLGEQRRFMLATFEAFARRMTGELKESIARIPPPPSIEALTPPPQRRQWWPVALTALLAALPALVLGYLALHTHAANQSLSRELAESRVAEERARAAAIEASATASASAAGNATVVGGLPGGVGGPVATGPVATEYVPYGETPFAGDRLERLRTLATMLEGQKFKGSIRVESFVGDFCLSGNASDGFALAEAGLAAPKCDLVGNPFDDALSAAQHQSVDFANFTAMLRQRTAGDIQVDVVNAGRREPAAYPEQDEKTTAGAWNTVAAQNNRVEFSVLPAT